MFAALKTQLKNDTGVPIHAVEIGIGPHADDDEYLPTPAAGRICKALV